MTGLRKPLQRFEVTFLAEEKFNITLEISAYDTEGLFEMLNERIDYDLSEINNLKVRRKHHHEK